jgi:iron(III) transport system ATP-binding protein
LAKGEAVAVAIRPENVAVAREKPKTGVAANVLQGRVESVVFLGDALDCYVEIGGIRVRADLHPSVELQPNDDVFVSFHAIAARVVPNSPSATPASVGA